VTLVGVTKYVGIAAARTLVEHGCHDLGESRPQALWEKAADEQLGPVRWHLIGHLQRNKVRRTLRHVDLIHSADSARLLAALDQEAAQLDRIMPVLLEVNVSGDAAKHGFSPAGLESLLPGLGQYHSLLVRGLMTMAARAGGAAEAERNFARLRELRDAGQKVCPDEVQLAELSMGMSGDFEAAVRQGATLVRVGSALFEGHA